jgi:hypothetical protein
VKHYIQKFINLLMLFGIRKSCPKNLLLYIYKNHIKVTIVIIKAYNYVYIYAYNYVYV